jgi:hypothetical protein
VGRRTLKWTFRVSKAIKRTSEEKPETGNRQSIYLVMCMDGYPRHITNQLTRQLAILPVGHAKQAGRQRTSIRLLIAHLYAFRGQALHNGDLAEAQSGEESWAGAGEDLRSVPNVVTDTRLDARFRRAALPGDLGSPTWLYPPSSSIRALHSRSRLIPPRPYCTIAVTYEVRDI